MKGIQFSEEGIVGALRGNEALVRHSALTQ